MTWFFGSRKSLIFALALAFTLAIGIRFYDLTDLPLDFASTRQLFSALKARGMYYAMLPADSVIPAWHREIAIRQWQNLPIIEPPVIETITAVTYRVFGEHLWIARIYSSLFWLLSGILLFMMAKEISGASGAFVSLLYYLFLPYGVLASRSFQPDPLMVSLIVAGAWATLRWANMRTWKWVLAAGILNGLAIFVKNVAVFPLAFAAAALVFECGFFKSLKDKQTWAVAGLSILLPAIYTIYGVFLAGFLGQQFTFRFFPQLWSDPSFYLRWKGQLDAVIGFQTFAVALAGIFVAQKRGLAVLAGLWLGYFAFGMTFAYHISTHEYYQIMLIPIVALSLSPMAETFFETAHKLRGGWYLRAILLMLITLAVAIQVWNIRVELIRADWRPEADFWQALGEKLGHNGPVLTVAQDYGSRLAYWGWQDVETWVFDEDIKVRELSGRNVDWLARFKDVAQGKSFFIITLMSKLENQPEVRNYIFDTYPILDKTSDYIIFDLRHLQKP